MVLQVCWVYPVFGYSGPDVFWSLLHRKFPEEHASKTEFESVPLCEGSPSYQIK